MFQLKIYQHYFQLKIYNKTIVGFSLRFSRIMYNKTIIGFGFCDMQNYQCLGNYLDIDNSAYHKNLIQ